MRYTIKDLREEIARANDMLSASGSTYYLREQGRNGYQAVDVYRSMPDGHASCQKLLESGTSKECAAAVRLFAAQYPGYIYPQKETELTREQAKRVLIAGGVDVEKDFFQLSVWDVDKLIVWAKLTRYRRPKNANGSLARYFFANLQKKDINQ